MASARQVFAGFIDVPIEGAEIPIEDRDYFFLAFFAGADGSMDAGWRE
ncbi:MAG: hypothetical protein M3O41_16220 [Pseudomonadota bacterium]|nr:hypothetical protein [Pseudomonadota bacterium]